MAIGACLQGDAVATQISFVTNESDLRRIRALLKEFRPQSERICGFRGCCVHYQQDPVSLTDSLEGTLHTDHFNLVLSVAQTGSVHDMQGHPVDVDMFTQYIASRAGNLGDDGRFPARQSIQQAGLARIGTTGDHHCHAVPQQSTLPCFT
ncbi:ATP-dependent Clp protease ATP-binding subunit ClpA [Pseudomonas syringae pv. actinidiae]|uniref:ATP-dependent Clp protease ATP-binding subunit ClpA n=1 Tax=Pseudomonas syringae pv. actinidiae TaxID=103796 RepID=A0A2V0QLQ9_PSESF|nr:ATP-dependent Clp protease ATP-binding subunit ClpA [Pseudomonas syringae pv. actinidiae]